jgi:hypothetical protein
MTGLVKEWENNSQAGTSDFKNQRRFLEKSYLNCNGNYVGTRDIKILYYMKSSCLHWPKNWLVRQQID